MQADFVNLVYVCFTFVTLLISQALHGVIYFCYMYLSKFHAL
jgi:hypothetical protein